jgi:hypothetical protein
MPPLFYRRHRFPPEIMLKKQGFLPKIVVTDKPRSHACAF